MPAICPGANHMLHVSHMLYASHMPHVSHMFRRQCFDALLCDLSVIGALNM